MESTCNNAKDYGYKLGDLFVYVGNNGNSTWIRHSVVRFVRDDNSSCPLFEALHESAQPYRFGPNGEPWAYAGLANVRPAGYYEVLGYLLDHYTQAQALKIIHDLYGDEDTIERILEDADL